jgi:hypothetical protein
MRFEWDRNKAAANVKKHRVSFDEAVAIFYGPVAATFENPIIRMTRVALSPSATPLADDFWSSAMLSEAPGTD